jgi:hypothetical protein
MSVTTGKFVKSWQEHGRAYLAVRVDEPEGAVEYIGSVDVEELVDLTPAERRAVMVGAVKSVRDAQRGGVVEITGFPGTITL